MNFRNMDEFWPYFVSQHSKPATRRWHFAGVFASILCLIYSFTFNWCYLFGVPVLAYGAAWYSHFFVERNVPASFDYPLWSFLCDMKMFGLILTGQMDKEIRRLGKKPVPRDY
ncbi:L-rhamnose-proton symporter like [Heracleum sosnowskyi]|uniref:L-rhamnose-proton symporter like n=1 Tax=Heracleum sosnowskyi TaxID=360622 RepID=A0AAD8MIQ2_9APIA|nr:L-rhamnose-proton symporter like [Heracleum sosnowskyi]